LIGEHWEEILVGYLVAFEYLTDKKYNVKKDVHLFYLDLQQKMKLEEVAEATALLKRIVCNTNHEVVEEMVEA
jgi:hypothetical protein